MNNNLALGVLLFAFLCLAYFAGSLFNLEMSRVKEINSVESTNVERASFRIDQEKTARNPFLNPSCGQNCSSFKDTNIIVCQNDRTHSKLSFFTECRSSE